MKIDTKNIDLGNCKTCGKKLHWPSNELNDEFDPNGRIYTAVVFTLNMTKGCACTAEEMYDDFIRTYNGFGIAVANKNNVRTH